MDADPWGRWGRLDGSSNRGAPIREGSTDVTGTGLVSSKDTSAEFLYSPNGQDGDAEVAEHIGQLIIGWGEAALCCARDISHAGLHLVKLELAWFPGGASRSEHRY